jgi:hypothetical protein
MAVAAIISGGGDERMGGMERGGEMKAKSESISIGCGPVAAIMLIATVLIACGSGFSWLGWLILAPVWLPLAILSLLVCAALLFAVFAVIFGK